MKTIGIEEANLDSCVKDAQSDRIIITRNGKPVAMIIGLETTIDEERSHPESNNTFSTFMAVRHNEKNLLRSHLEGKQQKK